MERARAAASRLRRHAWSLVVLLLVVFGSRAWLVRQAGSSLPLWDQWSADFQVLVLPLAEGQLRWEDVTSTFNNEHRLLAQRLLTLAQIALSGRWEPRDGLVLSAAVRAAGLAVVYLLLGRHQSRSTRRTLLLLLAAVGSLPVGTFNLLSAFQVALLLTEPLSVAALALLCGGALSVEGVAVAGGLLLLVLLTMATASITALAAVLVLSLRLALGRSRDAGATAAVVAFLAVFGVFAFLSTPHLAAYSARSAAEFTRTLAALLAWPFPDVPALGALTLIPPALLLRRLVRERTPPGQAWFVLSLSIYFLLQDVAIAFARGGARTGYPQYADGFWLGHVAGFVALVEALRPAPGEAARWRARACLLWAAWLGFALLADAALRGAPTLYAVRTAVALREPRFGEALRTGQLAEFERESRLTTDAVRRRDYRFFDHPAGRFVIPDFIFPELARHREELLAWFPASLAGARPSGPTRALATLGGLGPAFLACGLLLGFAGWRRERRDLADGASSGT